MIERWNETYVEEEIENARKTECGCWEFWILIAEIMV